MIETPENTRPLRTTTAPPLGQRRGASAAPCSVPKVQLLDLMFGWALMEQGFSNQQAAGYLRAIKAARPAGMQIIDGTWKLIEPKPMQLEPVTTT